MSFFRKFYVNFGNLRDSLKILFKSSIKLRKFYIYENQQNFEPTFQKIRKKVDNLMKFNEKFTYGGNKKILKKLSLNFV